MVRKLISFELNTRILERLHGGVGRDGWGGTTFHIHEVDTQGHAGLGFLEFDEVELVEGPIASTPGMAARSGRPAGEYDTS